MARDVAASGGRREQKGPCRTVQTDSSAACELQMDPWKKSETSMTFLTVCVCVGYLATLGQGKLRMIQEGNRVKFIKDRM